MFSHSQVNPILEEIKEVLHLARNEQLNEEAAPNNNLSAATYKRAELEKKKENPARNKQKK
jgi:hypothetical protein